MLIYCLRFLLPALLLTAGYQHCSAQSLHKQLRLSAGAGVCWPVSKGNSASYSPVVLPQAALQWYIPLSAKAGVLTGLAYLQKGYDSRSELRGAPPNDADLDVTLGRTRYHFLSIPLQVSVRLYHRRQWALCLEGGMMYDFLLRAQTDWEWNTYRYDHLISTNTYVARPKIGLLPRDNLVASNGFGYYPSLYLFNTSVAAALTLALRGRYLLRAFYEYNLNDLASVETIGAGTLHLQVAGLSLGVGF